MQVKRGLNLDHLAGSLLTRPPPPHHHKFSQALSQETQLGQTQIIKPFLCNKTLFLLATHSRLLFQKFAKSSFIFQRRTERDKTDLMKELKDRLANRVQIREEQEMEEMAEMEREKEEERCRRIEHVS